MVMAAGSVGQYLLLDRLGIPPDDMSTVRNSLDRDVYWRPPVVRHSP